MPATFLSAADRLAFDQFPHTISHADLSRYFRLSPQDLDQLTHFRGPHNHLGIALQLCSLRYLGFVPADLLQIPAVALDYLAGQLHTTPEPLQHYGRRQQTRAHHLSLMAHYLGFQPFSPTLLPPLQDWLLARALEHDKPTLLLQLLVQKLYTDQIVRPGLSTLEKLVTQVRLRAEQVTFEHLQPLLSPKLCQALDKLLQVDDAIGHIPLTWLRRPATTNSPPAILSTLQKLRFLKQLGIAQWQISALNPNRLKFLAQLGKRTSPQALQRTTESKRYPILVAFLYQIHLEIIDEAIDLFLHCLGETYARARHAHKEAHLQAAVALNEKVRLLLHISTVLLDAAVPEEQVRPQIFQQIPQPLLEEAVADCQQLLRPTPDHAIDFFVARYSYLRQFIPAFLQTFQFQSSFEPDALLEALQLLIHLDTHKLRSLPPDTAIHAVPHSWRQLLREQPPSHQRRYYEMGILWQLRSSLRAGTIAVAGSKRFAPLDQDLIPAKIWPALRSEFAQLLPCALQAQPRLDQLSTQLQAQLRLFQQTLETSDSVRLEDDRLIVSPLPTQK